MLIWFPCNQLIIKITIKTLNPHYYLPQTCGGGSNPYIPFLYGPHNIYIHTHGQVSGSIHSDPVNEKYKGQQSTMEALCD